MSLVAEIFRIKNFKALLGPTQIARGSPVADPFLVARAKLIGACVVTEEKFKPNAPKIPNVCQHFDVECMDMQGFLREAGWTF
jgi:hypothetical protein